MRPKELWICLDTEPPGLCPWLSTALVVGPFEEEEEGIGIASDVVKVKGEDPEPPGCIREGRVRRYFGDSQSWVRTPWLVREETPAASTAAACRCRSPCANKNSEVARRHPGEGGG